MRNRASCARWSPARQVDGFVVQHGLGCVRSIYTGFYAQGIQPRAFHELAHCFQEDEEHMLSSHEKNYILTFRIRPYQFIASAVQGLVNCDEGACFWPVSFEMSTKQLIKVVSVSLSSASAWRMGSNLAVVEDGQRKMLPH